MRTTLIVAKLDGSKHLAESGCVWFDGLVASGSEVMRGQSGFFDIDERLKRLSDLGDQLAAFAGRSILRFSAPNL